MTNETVVGSLLEMAGMFFGNPIDFTGVNSAFLPGMILGVLSLALGIPILVFGAVQIVRSVRLYKMMGRCLCRCC